ncbi:hypothetical protein AVEN_62464-1 [Araneus ventricosus]|uniref:Uncharacterized protein n=1 Tax=Araneus ventricosus TaxID=182803 RepID=A0A4Y2NQ50_ARAVE|nr:hypothetical protein AVEN_62464-1 [Araneus ventricosus]
MESSSTFKRISSPNRDIEKIPAPLRSHISSPKSPRLSCYEDVLKRLFLSSDPVLTSMRPTMRKKSKAFLKETLEMFLPMESSEVLDEKDSAHEETDNDINDLSSDE